MTRPSVSIQAIEATALLGSRRIVDTLSLSVSAGEVVALRGANGCGKTTALNMFSGLFRPHTGDVRLYGIPVGSASPAAIARLVNGVARSFQVPFLQDEHTVWMNVLLARRIARAAGQDRAMFSNRARAMLDALGLTSICDAPAGTLSVGQRRRVEHARVLASGAGVLLLDEPFANLDVSSIEITGKLLRAEAARGVAVLLVEHRHDAITRFCDRSILM